MVEQLNSSDRTCEMILHVGGKMLCIHVSMFAFRKDIASETSEHYYQRFLSDRRVNAAVKLATDCCWQSSLGTQAGQDETFPNGYDEDPSKSYARMRPFCSC